MEGFYAMAKREREKRRKGMHAHTTINLSFDTRARLERLKYHPREPYDSVIRRMLTALKSLMNVANDEELRTRLLEYEAPTWGVDVGKEVDKELRRLRG